MLVVRRLASHEKSGKNQERSQMTQSSGEVSGEKGCILPIDGAGDGNRTHVRSLGSFYTAIVRRPPRHELDENITDI